MLPANPADATMRCHCVEIMQGLRTRGFGQRVILRRPCLFRRLPLRHPLPCTRLRLRVVHKLFLLLALLIALALGAMDSITVLNLRSGFVAYLNALEK